MWYEAYFEKRFSKGDVHTREHWPAEVPNWRRVTLHGLLLEKLKINDLRPLGTPISSKFGIFSFRWNNYNYNFSSFGRSFKKLKTGNQNGNMSVTRDPRAPEVSLCVNAASSKLINICWEPRDVQNHLKKNFNHGQFSSFKSAIWGGNWQFFA